MDEELKGFLAAMEQRLAGKIETTETTLLREFRKWAVPVESRQRNFNVTLEGFEERLTLLEDWMHEQDDRNRGTQT